MHGISVNVKQDIIWMMIINVKNVFVKQKLDLKLGNIFVMEFVQKIVVQPSQ